MIKLKLTLYLFLSLNLKAQVFTKQSFYNYIVECNIKYPDIVYKQSCLETGWFTSNVFTENNNLFGFRICGKYIRFSHWKECVRYYALYQKNRLKEGENYYSFLKRIGYAEDTLYCKKLKKLKLKL